jgi:hypothetical protein
MFDIGYFPYFPWQRWVHKGQVSSNMEMQEVKVKKSKAIPITGLGGQ